MNKEKYTVTALNKNSDGGIILGSGLESLYDNTTNTIKIINVSKSNQMVADIKLNTPINNQVGLGYQKVAEFYIMNFQNYTNALDKIQFYNKKNLEKEIQIDYEYKVKINQEVKVDDYGSIECVDNKDKKNLTQECKYGVVGYHLEKKEAWIPLSKSDFKEGDNITVGIFTTTKEGDKIEWIPTYYETKIYQWAGWDASLYTGLVAYFSADESAGSYIINNVTQATNYSILLSGTANTHVAGKLGNAMNFSGGTGSGTDGDNKGAGVSPLPTDQTGAFTFSYWYRNQGNSVGGCAIASSRVGGNYWQLSLNDQAGSAESFTDLFWGLSTVNAWTVNNLYPYNTWVFTVLTYSGSNMTLYKNGIMNQTSSRTGTQNKGSKTYYGSDEGWSGTKANVCDGQLDEFGFWNRTLTQTEITALYNDGAGLVYGSSDAPANCWGYDGASKMLSIPTGCSYKGGTL